MKSKQKLSLSIIIAIFGLLALICSIVIIAISAASNQNVLSNISVSYEAEGVSTNVSARYYIGSDEGLDMTTTGKPDGETSLVFARGKETKSNTLNPQGDILLSFANNYVVFEYRFENQGMDFEAILKFTGTAENISLYQAESTTEPIQDYSEVSSLINDPKDFEVYSFIEEGATKYVYLKVEISQLQENATFEGNFVWDLGPDLSKELTNTFTFIDNTTSYSISGLQPGINVTNLEIPSYYKGKPVTKFEKSAFSSTTATSITFGPNITDVGSGFASNLSDIYYSREMKSWCETKVTNLENLLNSSSRNLYIKNGEDYTLLSKEIVIPDNVMKIEAYKFYYRPVASITIGKNVAVIGKGTFDHCENVTKLNFNAISVADFESSNLAFDYLGYKSGSVEVVFGDNVKRIPNRLFYYNDTLSSSNRRCDNRITVVKIGKNVTSIGVESFNYNIYLTTLYISSSVVNIGNFAFYYCEVLKDIILDSEIIYNTLINSSSCGNLLYRFNKLSSNSGTIKVLADIDNGNSYINSYFTKGEQRETIDEKLYNVYTRKSS